MECPALVKLKTQNLRKQPLILFWWRESLVLDCSYSECGSIFLCHLLSQSLSLTSICLFLVLHSLFLEEQWYHDHHHHRSQWILTLSSLTTWSLSQPLHPNSFLLSSPRWMHASHFRFFFSSSSSPRPPDKASLLTVSKALGGTTQNSMSLSCLLWSGPSF